jgi:protein-S-isoprenylcysteine O-methyltransferase Ste14
LKDVGDDLQDCLSHWLYNRISSSLLLCSAPSIQQSERRSQNSARDCAARFNAAWNVYPALDWHFYPWLEFADYHLPGWTGWTGAVVFGVAIWLFWRAHDDLGLNWSASLEIRENHSLVDNGVYRYVRHPMYAAFWLWGIAQVLLLHNWIYGLSYLVSFVPMYFRRIRQEEQMMIDTFGEQYQNYMTQTGRVIPKLSQTAG